MAHAVATPAPDDDREPATAPDAPVIDGDDVALIAELRGFVNERLPVHQATDDESGHWGDLVVRKAPDLVRSDEWRAVSAALLAIEVAAHNLVIRLSGPDDPRPDPPAPAPFRLDVSGFGRDE